MSRLVLLAALLAALAAGGCGRKGDPEAPADERRPAPARTR